MRGEPIRIAILLPNLRGGGAERTSLAIAAGLLRRGHEIDLVLNRFVCDYPVELLSGERLFYLERPGGDERSAAGRKPLPVTPEPLFRGRHPFRVRYPRLSLAAALSWSDLSKLSIFHSSLRWAAATAVYLDRERPDALLAMMVPSVVAATKAALMARHRVRIVGSLHTVARFQWWLDRARWSYPRVDAAVGVSCGVAAELTEVVGVPADRVHTIYDPVVSADLARAAERPADHPWLDRAGPQVVLAAGRLSEEKDFPTLLAAFAKVLARRSARLIVLGKGPLLPTLTAQAEKLGIARHVDFPGFVENPYAFMAKAGVFVLTSRVEGLGNVLIQAMACGCPVVSTDCPYGPRDILEDGRWGELVPIGDSQALSEAMLRTLDCPPPRETLRERASAFGVDRAVTRYEALLLDRGAGAGFFRSRARFSTPPRGEHRPMIR